MQTFLCILSDDALYLYPNSRKYLPKAGTTKTVGSFIATRLKSCALKVGSCCFKCIVISLIYFLICR